MRTSRYSKSLAEPADYSGADDRTDSGVRRRDKSRQFLQRAFESVETDMAGWYQGALSGLYHAQRRSRRI